VAVDTWYAQDTLYVRSGISGNIGATVIIPNIEDGLDHKFHISWNAISSELKVYLDDQLTLTTTVPGGISAQLPGNPSHAYFGFTAATGGAFNVQKVCNPVFAKSCSAQQLPIQTATASSVESDRYVAYWAVDGNPNSRWASDGPAADGAPEEQWLLLDMGGVRFIDSVNLEWERAYSRDYEVQVSIDGNIWETVRSIQSENHGEVQVGMLNTVGRYVRILSHEGDRNYGISLYEVKIFGDSDENCAPPPTTCLGDVIELGAAQASASSEEGPHWSAAKAVDGDWDS
jgi:hypothetical protein